MYRISQMGKLRNVSPLITRNNWMIVTMIGILIERSTWMDRLGKMSRNIKKFWKKGRREKNFFTRLKLNLILDVSYILLIMTLIMGESVA